MRFAAAFVAAVAVAVVLLACSGARAEEEGETIAAVAPVSITTHKPSVQGDAHGRKVSVTSTVSHSGVTPDSVDEMKNRKSSLEDEKASVKGENAEGHTVSSSTTMDGGSSGDDEGDDDASGDDEMPGTSPVSGDDGSGSDSADGSADGSGSDGDADDDGSGSDDSSAAQQSEGSGSGGADEVESIAGVKPVRIVSSLSGGSHSYVDKVPNQLYTFNAIHESGNVAMDAIQKDAERVTDAIDRKDPKILQMHKQLVDTIKQMETDRAWVEQVRRIIHDYTRKIANVELGLRMKGKQAYEIKRAIVQRHKDNAKAALAQKLNQVKANLQKLHSQASHVRSQQAGLYNVKENLMKSMGVIQAHIAALHTNSCAHPICS